jgi:subtilisin family serine protease
LSFCTVVITLPCFAFDTVVGPTINGWSVNFGTSAATPHVAGVAALVIGAHGGQMNPDAVEAILRASADDLGKPASTTSTAPAASTPHAQSHSNDPWPQRRRKSRTS